MKPLLPLLLLAACCGGCETVVFESSPVAAQACDPQLVGDWLSVGDRPGNAGEVELRIDAACTLLFVEHDKGAPRLGEPTALHVGHDGRIAYAWVDARWAEERMDNSSEAEPKLPEEPSEFAAGDIVLMRYRVSARKLEFSNAEPKLFAHRIIDEKIKGEVSRNDQGRLAVRVSAPVDAKALRDARLFPRGEMRFEHASTHD
jgi:hypothetical protein